MKKLAKKAVAGILWAQVGRLRKKNNFKVMAVAGSVGKTSTKLAVAKILSQKYKVQWQEGNYNDLVSVPLIFFGQQMPSLFNPAAWIWIFLHNEIALRKNYPFDVVILELGTDAPGQLAEFKPYLSADIGVLTGIALEHMEFFDSLDAVANEELTISELCSELIINKDLTKPKYAKKASVPVTYYSIEQPADVRLGDVKFEGYTSSFTVTWKGKKLLSAEHEMISEPLLYAAVAGVATGLRLGLNTDEIAKGLDRIKPFAGRMNRLAGINGSVIIDDTYNASPEAVKAALKTLYRLNAPHKIAVLGNMNELGEYSEEAHRQIGGLCDPKKLDLVLTIGPDANKQLAPAAKSKGCQVKTFDDPYSAGEYLKHQLKKDSLVLVKGSQNGVFAEEAVKLILADPSDSDKLVRQSKYWLNKKQKAFGA